MSALADVLSALTAGRRPGLVVLDDAHWADSASLDVIGFLVRRLRGRAVCIALSWRTEDVPSGHPLRELVADARRSRLALVVAPERLDRAAVAELARVAGAESSADRLYDQTDGLPLFVVEYLAALGESSGGDVPKASPSSCGAASRR